MVQERKSTYAKEKADLKYLDLKFKKFNEDRLSPTFSKLTNS